MNNRRAQGLATYQRTTTNVGLGTGQGTLVQRQKSSVDDFRDEAIRRQIKRKREAEKVQMMEEYLRFAEKKRKQKLK